MFGLIKRLFSRTTRGRGVCWKCGWEGEMDDHTC